MKKLLLLLCLSLIVQITQAQEIGFKLKSGELTNFKMSDFATDLQDLGTISNYAYFLFTPYQSDQPFEINLSGKNPFIYKCDRNNNIVQKTELVLKSDKKELQFVDVLKLKEKLLVFSSFQNSKDKKHYLFVQNVDPVSTKLVENIKIAAELDYSGFSKFSHTTFAIEVSPDSSKILIFYSLQNKNYENLRSGIHVYDNELNLVWKNDNVASEFTKGIFGFQRFKLDNNGVVYLLGQHFDSKSNYYDQAQFKSRGFFSNDTYYTDVPNYTFVLYRYTKNESQSEKFALTIPNKFIRSLNFSPQINGSVNCVGMYSEAGKISVTGSFSFNVNLDSKSIENLNTLELGKELLSRDLSPEELKRFRRSIDNKQEWDPYTYTLSDLKTKQNGDSYFIAEQHIEGSRKITTRTTQGVQITYSGIFVGNDLFVVNLNNDNTIKRIDKITKRQFWLDTDKFNSYAELEKDNNLYFLYNTFEQKDALFKNIEVGESFITRIDGNGSQVKSVFKQKEDDKSPIPVLRQGLQVADNAIMYGLFSITMRAKYQIQQLIITE